MGLLCAARGGCALVAGGGLRTVVHSFTLGRVSLRVFPFIATWGPTGAVEKLLIVVFIFIIKKVT